MTRTGERMEVAGLRRALDHLERGDQEAALGELLDVWRSTRAVAVAVLVEALGARIGARRPPLSGATVTTRHAAWLARAAAPGPDPGDVSALLAVLLDGVKSGPAAERLAAMASWPEDPRVASTLARIAAKPPFQAGTTRRFWDTLFPLLAQHGDPRAIEVLGPLADGYVALVGAQTMGERMKKALDAALAALRARHPDGPPALDAEASNVVAAIAALDARTGAVAAAANARAAQDEASLLAEVFASPDDDGPRAVYADWLLERGDPRGEFIAHQLHTAGTRAPMKGEAAFMKQHKNALLGRLAPVLSNLAFHRGFVAGAKLGSNKNRRLLAEAVGLPEWSTMLWLSLPDTSYWPDDDIQDLVRILTGSDLRLRALSGGDSRLVCAYVARGAPLLTRVSTMRKSEALFEALAAHAPKIEEVELTTYGRTAACLRGDALERRLGRPLST